MPDVETHKTKLSSRVAAVAAQYERFPYPALPWLAMPRKAATHPLAYELGQYLRTGRYVAHDRKTRILIAGSGTFEPLVARRAHPRAEIVALDLSAASLRRLRLRAWLAGFFGLECVQADLHDDLGARLGSFDYIICTGVIHHSPTPDVLLGRLSQLLKPTGVLRVMTYAASSRRWIYELQRFFKKHGTAPNLKSCERELERLPARHPLRAAFATYDDRLSPAGLVDGFFHECDEPLSIDHLRTLSTAAGLKLIGFGHAWHSQPAGLSAQLAQARAPSKMLEAFDRLDAWERLACVDSLGELAVNPVLWLAREVAEVTPGLPRETSLNPVLESLPDEEEFLAPLAPAAPDSLHARLTKRHALEAARETALIGGVLLGCDGVMPEALAQNRAVENKPHLAKNIATPHAHAPAPSASPSAPLVPARVREEALRGMREFFARLELRPTPEALRALAGALEPRIDREGHTLDWLSTGDLLRELIALGELSFFTD